MNTRLTREDCALMIQQKAKELGRIPKKSDFSDEEVSTIKSFFGPWPRALEAAKVKEPDLMRIEKKRQKRIRARNNRIRYRKEHETEKERD